MIQLSKTYFYINLVPVSSFYKLYIWDKNIDYSITLNRRKMPSRSGDKRQPPINTFSKGE